MRIASHPLFYIVHQVIMQRLLEGHQIAFTHDFELSRVAKLSEGPSPGNLCKGPPPPPQRAPSIFHGGVLHPYCVRYP